MLFNPASVSMKVFDFQFQVLCSPGLINFYYIQKNKSLKKSYFAPVKQTNIGGKEFLESDDGFLIHKLTTTANNGQLGQIEQYMLAHSSKGHCHIAKILSPLVLSTPLRLRYSFFRDVFFHRYLIPIFDKGFWACLCYQ